jgi:hypothetical protein
LAENKAVRESEEAKVSVPQPAEELEEKREEESKPA